MGHSQADDVEVVDIAEFEHKAVGGGDEQRPIDSEDQAVVARASSCSSWAGVAADRFELVDVSGLGDRAQGKDRRHDQHTCEWG